ncbi:SDR family NAD(P)-dependent oxidoreductase [uncultured Sphingomonas sp.]|uniref:SDR family NAD(P)-dependent oxidoreductase n=1 Tax=uncultured Sphingomonas sp. TaxID=158754 RepID=UPI0035CACA7E
MPDNILITGAGSGFGLLTVQTLLGKGLTIYAGIRDPQGRNAEKAANLQRLAKGSDGELVVVDLDVLDEADCRAAADTIMARDGRIDAVFHNAGHLYIGYTEAFTPDQLSEAFRSNALGAHVLNRAVLPFMRAAGRGTLIYNSSGSARVIGPFMGPYVLGKMAFDALAEATAYEANAFGIETVIIMPGAFTQGTSHFDTHAAPQDAEVVRAYARLQPDFDQYGPGLEQLFEGRDQPPQAVADEVARVLAIPRGQKPLRTEVDFSEWGAGVCNVVAEYETARLWGNMGLGHLLRVAIGQDESGEQP